MRWFVFLTCLLLPACGGGGGGDNRRESDAPDAVPTLIGAVFLGGSPTPRPGDRLRLYFSEPVVIPPASLLDDDALVFGTLGETLGNVLTAPTLHSPRAVDIVLGAGVGFVPGVTTLDFAPSHSVITDRTGNPAQPAVARLVSQGDADDPEVHDLTLNQIHEVLNGNGPAGGTLQVPTHGFSIDLRATDATGLDPHRTVVVASVTTAVDGENRQPGLDLADGLTVTAQGDQLQLEVGPRITLPEGSIEFTVFVFDSTGRMSPGATFAGRIRRPEDALVPFETTVHPSQVWYIDTSRDLESYTVHVFDFVTPLRVHNGGNGRADLEDVMHALGLLSDTPIPNVLDTLDSNQVVLQTFRNEVLQHLQTVYAGANVTFTFAPPGPWPGGSQRPYESVAFSQIALSGAADASGRTGIHGIALFDPNNVHQDDNTQADFQDTERLGVFLHTVVNNGIVAHPTTSFRTTFDAFTPARFGTAIGEDPNDLYRLRLVLQDYRATLMANAVVRLAQFAAVILAHECGHSVGLVANGAMPDGLFGDQPAAFPVFPASAADGHIKMPPSIFGGLSENIMTPGFDFDSALAPDTRFNSLNRAYLLQRVVVNGN